MRSSLYSLACLAVLAGAAQPSRVVVVTIPDVAAYAETVSGIRELFPDLEVWDGREGARLQDRMVLTQPGLIITVGATAAALVARLAPPHMTLVNSVVLASDLDNDGALARRFKAAVTIDLPPDTLFSEIARIFPGRTRLGVIRGPTQTELYMKSLEQAARRAGLTPETIACDQPRDLVETFLKLRSRVDLVWCPPDAILYNSATLKPLLVASLTNRLPIIGFSEQFVQAGALFGGSADFLDVGRQTASLAARLANDEPAPSRQSARKFRFAYNQRVARLLGVKAVLPDNPGELTVIR